MSTSKANQEPSVLTYWHEGLECCDTEWEAAYARFETPDEEIAKFTARFHKLGVDRLPRDLQVVDLFCGRGNGLQSLAVMGFSRLEGVDLSASLLEQSRGSAKLYVADCRELKFESDSKGLMIVQGGLHHLPSLPDDLEDVLSEVQRVLKPGGYFMVVEPWLTPFLRVVHTACSAGLLRQAWGKLDALACMIDRERTTYFKWLGQPRVIDSLLNRYFNCERRHVSFGELLFVGRKG